MLGNLVYTGCISILVVIVIEIVLQHCYIAHINIQENFIFIEKETDKETETGTKTKKQW